jgi:hypothetical protein
MTVIGTLKVYEEESNSGMLHKRAGLMGAGVVETVNRTSEATA